MGPVEVIEAFPFTQSFLKIDITFVAKQLIEFLLVRSMRSLDFSVQLWRCTSDVSVANTEVFGKRRPRPIGFSLSRCRGGLKRMAVGSSSGTTIRGPYEPSIRWV